MAKDDILHFDMESGVSMFDGKPFVNISMKRRDGGIQSLQVRPKKARELARMFFESAVEAERDAATMSGAQEIGLDKETAGMLLAMIRQERTNWEDID
jgi:hypothetical protein